MDLYTFAFLIKISCYTVVILLLFLMIRGMYRLVVWSKKMPKGAFILLAIFPLISIFPIPHQEIKKIERIRQEQVNEGDENGEPKNKNTDKTKLKIKR